MNRMLDQLREGDIVSVWKLDRLARSTRNLLEIVESISNVGARFQSISEPRADTATHAGKMIMTIFAGIAESERDLIRERTGAGRIDAQKRGVRFGRPTKMNKDQRKLAHRSCTHLHFTFVSDYVLFFASYVFLLVTSHARSYKVEVIL
jgi:DNA invertase Pin-like site-specific DNA recombinase